MLITSSQFSIRLLHSLLTLKKTPWEIQETGWQFATRGLPSVSCNTIKKKTCTWCAESTYHQTPQDIDVNSIELYGQASSKGTFPHTLNSLIKDRAIQKHKEEFSTCTHCSSEFPLSQKTVMLDLSAHILCVGLNTGEKDNLRDLKEPNTILGGVELKSEHISGEERSVKYKIVALVYSSGPSH
ncbi:unnamed protein product [Aureobasidium mustum]|uniref:Uncharacterized protein n=1 Tax=Aureobasidium mustum TaxID=2773714 RepID=A0A9N8JI52_9PEZI|nr:unnamed protein product [Aureobasidium mustum]